MDRPNPPIEIHVHDGVFCVRLARQKMSEASLEQLSAALAALIEDEACRKMVLSLGPGDLDCLYSVFLATLINLKRRLAAVGGTVVLAEVSENTLGVFRAAGFDKHFQFYADPLGAVQALAAV